MDYYDKRDYLDTMESEVEGESQITDSYSNAHVFITGATGLIGKLLLEKLLRSCDVAKIYLLMREKKGVSAQERMNIILDDVLFDRVRMEKQNIREKLNLVAGDCSLPKLGVSNDDCEMLCKNVTHVFHAAALLSMDEHLRKAFIINVSATETLLKMAKNMLQLKAFIYVSTAFSHPSKLKIDEVFYETPFTDTDLKHIVDTMDDVQVGGLTPKLVERSFNTYSLTKAIAENLIQKYSQELPVAVVRPSIVVSTVREPICGWISNIYGATGVLATAAMGLLRVWKADKNKIADLVPADISTNAMIAAAWHIGSKKPTHNNQPVYNVVTYSKNPITWGLYNILNERSAYDQILAFSQSVGTYDFRLVTNNKLFSFYTLYYHVLPGLIMDFGIKLMGDSPKLMKAYRKMYYVNNLLGWYCTNEFTFSDKNVDAIWNDMSPKDRKLFNFDMTQFTWEEYYFHCMKGVRVYLFNDPMETLEYARNRYYMFVRWLRVWNAVKYSLIGYLLYSVTYSWF